MAQPSPASVGRLDHDLIQRSFVREAQVQAEGRPVAGLDPQSSGRHAQHLDGEDAQSCRMLQPAGDLFMDADVHSEDVFLDPFGLCGTELHGSGSSSATEMDGGAGHAGEVSAGGGAAAHQERFASGGDDWRTTVMIRRLAPGRLENDVRSALDALGFAGSYDAVCMPLNRKKTSSLGFVCVNFATPGHARACIEALDCATHERLTDKRACRAWYSDIQGADGLRQAMESSQASRRRQPGTRAGSTRSGGHHVGQHGAGSSRPHRLT